MTKKFKTIYDPNAAFGGWEYKAVSDGEVVKIMERSPSASRFIAKQQLSPEQWDGFVNRNGLDDPYENMTNPAIISRLAQIGLYRYEQEKREGRDGYY